MPPAARKNQEHKSTFADELSFRVCTNPPGIILITGGCRASDFAQAVSVPPIHCEPEIVHPMEMNTFSVRLATHVAASHAIDVVSIQNLGKGPETPAPAHASNAKMERLQARPADMLDHGLTIDEIRGHDAAQILRHNPNRAEPSKRVIPDPDALPTISFLFPSGRR
jgi:hypothetical protein